MRDKDCKSFEELLVLQVYGELEESDKKPLEAHLAHCSSCQRQGEGLIRVCNEFAELKAPPPETTFVNECIEGLLEKKGMGQAAATSRDVQGRHFYLWPALSAAALLLMFVAYQAFRESPPNPLKENWLTASRAPQTTVHALTKGAVAPVVRPIDKIRLPQEPNGSTYFPHLVTAMVPLPKGHSYDSDLRWNDGLKTKLLKLSSRLATINNRHPGRESVTKYERLSKRLSRLNDAIERL